VQACIPRRGLALVLVVGVLGILVVLAASFVTMAHLERQASQRRLHAVRALLVARSGLEDALARLSTGQDPGRLEGATFRDGASCSLRVEDESAKINVNGGFLDASDRDRGGLGDGVPDYRDREVRRYAPSAANDPGWGWNYQLYRILGLLGQEPELGLPTLGTDVLARRPLGGYRSIAQLQELIGVTTDLSPWLTTSSWIDRKVVQPTGKADFFPPSTWYGSNSMNETKKYRLPLAVDAAGRPPVNLNAAPRPVLRALLAELTGFNFYNPSSPVPVLLTDRAAVELIADRMIQRRSAAPWTDWADFSAFCDTLPALLGGVPSTAAFRIYLPDLMKANFDSNTALSKDLPDQIKFRFVDKSDLRVWSTEGCLEPSGVFRISSLGRVLDAGGRLLARRELSMTARVWDLLRQTTQKDFLAGRPLALCHSLSTGLVPSTGAGASWRTWTGNGLATLSYPHPPTVPPAQAADFDGWLGLATLEDRVSMPPGAVRLGFLHHFDDSWTADSAVAPGRVPGSSDTDLQVTLTSGTWPSNGSEPNSFRPDGLHVQQGRSPGYSVLNFPSATSNLLYPGASFNHAVVSLWVKPTLPKYSLHFSLMKGTLPGTQIFQMGLTDYISGAWGTFLENRTEQLVDPERAAWVRRPDQPLRAPLLRWALESAYFDTDEAPGDELHFDLRSVYPPFSRDPDDAKYATPFDRALSEDLLAYDWTTRVPGRFVIGNLDLGRNGNTRANNNMANAVIDEVVICDFGNDGPAAKGLMARMASDRFADGRYYKENDGLFLSDRLVPGGESSRLLWAQWTAYLPREVRKEISGSTTVDRLQDPSLAGADVALDLLDPDGTFTSPGRRLSPRGSLAHKGPFRYRVLFRPTPDWSSPQRENQPVLETPFLDDVTFAWQPALGPTILDCASP